MTHKNRNSHDKPKDYFLKGFFLGLGAMVLAGGIGALVAYKIIKSRDHSGHFKELYKYNYEGGILSDTDLDDTTPPAFKDASEKLEKDYENLLKAQAETEEAAKNLRKMY